MSLNESIVEDAAREWFGELGYAVGHGPHLAPGDPAAERASIGEVVLVDRLREAIRPLNPAMGELTVRAGLASPEILEAGGCVTVRFSPTRYVPPQRVAQNVTERQQRVLAVLSTSAEGMALRDIRKGLGEEIAEWEIKNELAALKHLGLVQTKGYARGARWILS